MVEHIYKEAIDLVRSTGTFIVNNAGKIAPEQIEIKGKNSLVSYVDKEAEKMLVAGLSELLPSSVFITEEETTVNQDGEWQWIVDPLDGTTNFLYNIPIYSVSVALRHYDETVLGIVYHISADELFYARKGHGAFLNGEPISVSDKTTENALLATGFPYHDFDYLDEYIDVLKVLMQETRGLRRMGSAAIDLAYVAAGRFDIFFEYGLNPWDVAAGALIVREAGGIVSNFKAGPSYLFTQQIVAGNPAVHRDLIGLIEKYLGRDAFKIAGEESHLH